MFPLGLTVQELASIENFNYCKKKARKELI